MRRAAIKIRVCPARALQNSKRLFEALSGLYPVEFTSPEGTDWEGLDGAIFFGGTRKDGLEAAARGLACFVVINDLGRGSETSSAPLAFAPTPRVDVALRGQLFPEADNRRFLPLSFEAGDQVLASRGGHVVWMKLSTPTGSADLAAVAPPALGEAEYLYEHLKQGRFLALLPLLHFLKEVTGQSCPSPPGLRACVVLDDPNLHRLTYGCIDFRELVRHAKAHSYHAAMAMAPLDSWRADEEAAALFRKNPDQVSLLIHGNNHTFSELAQSRPESEQFGLLAQALVRIEQFERRHSLGVSRVMEPPHGHFLEETAGPMLRLGYEAVLMHAAQFLSRNRSANYPVEHGLGRAELVGPGLPAVPRQLMSAHWRTDALLAAFLDQPVVIAGHHQDVHDGLDFLAEIARTINNLGPVRWSDLQGIAQSSFSVRRVGATMSIAVAARKVRLRVPAGVDCLFVERPWVREQGGEELIVGEVMGGVAARVRAGKTAGPFAVRAGQEFMIHSLVPGALSPDQVPLPRTPLWVRGRKVLCEMRDRAYPLLYALRSSAKSRGGSAEQEQPEARVC